MDDFPSFRAFYAAVNDGRPPLPWQERLAGVVVDEGWPSLIGVPTGLGKTSCLDVAVWSLAAQADRPAGQRRLPLRVWWVVNRRLLVDAALAHGEHLAAALADPEHFGSVAVTAEHRGAVGAVAERLAGLAALGAAEGPLHTVRLRGGAELGARPPDPSQPTLLFATVAMFASRWLFRGYGTSTSMRPVDAALAGVDSLILVDEAHLAAPLAGLAEPLAECDPGDPDVVLSGRGRPVFVALTATGSQQPGRRFDLDGTDLANPVVHQRLHATKPTRLIPTTKKELPAVLAAHAAGLVDEHRRSCLVFANTPGRARQTVEHLRRQKLDADLLLLTGRTREREAAAVRDQLLDGDRGIPAGRRPAVRSRPLVVVATQTLEVGADIDADSLVTESAGVRALTQRFGRLNRLGEHSHAAAVICHAADLTEPLYGTEPAVVWERLHADEVVTVDLSPAEITERLGPPGDILPSGAEPLPALVWEWAKTSLAPTAEAPIEAYFAAGDDDLPRVSVCWRAHLPPAGVVLRPAVTAEETVELPVYELRAVLDERNVGVVHRLSSDRATVQTASSSELRPGDVILLEPTVGLYDLFGWNPDSQLVVLDISPLRKGSLTLSKDAVANLLADASDVAAIMKRVAELTSHDDTDGTDPLYDRDWAADLIAELSDAEPHPWITAEEWTAYCANLDHSVARPVGDAAFVPPTPRPFRYQRVEVRADAFDELSFDATSVQLDQHLGSVGQTARRIAAHLGLPTALQQAVEHAGRFHDLGKLDARFQRWLQPGGPSSAALAKSGLRSDQMEAARLAAGWPRGGRHEALSARLVQDWLRRQPTDDAELIVHLVISHHGHGRPLLAAVDDPTGGVLRATIDGVAIEAGGDLKAVDWDQPQRFRALCERYGYWGLALLEAVVRQADQAVSGVVAA